MRRIRPLLVAAVALATALAVPCVARADLILPGQTTRTHRAARASVPTRTPSPAASSAPAPGGSARASAPVEAQTPTSAPSPELVGVALVVVVVISGVALFAIRRRRSDSEL